jgi:hypothetical protein
MARLFIGPSGPAGCEYPVAWQRVKEMAGRPSVMTE